MQHEEQVRLRLPLTTSAIQEAVTAFQQQFGSPCYLYVQGHLILSTSERCLAPKWLPVVRSDPELDLLGIGDPDVCDEDETLLWVAPTNSAYLLLSSIKQR
jgi:hypothetical protein